MVQTVFPHLRYLRLVCASFIAGVMNAMAGGGSFLSFPALVAIGVLPIQANATNTVALWPGQLTSAATLRSDLRKDLLPVVAAASLIGGVGGATVLLHTPQVTFLNLVPWLLLVATLLFAGSGPLSRWLRRRSMTARDVQQLQRSPALVPLFLLLLPVCFYIGYFGAGAGFLIMSALALFGVEEMRELNSLKVLAACLSNFCAVVTFTLSGAIVWRYCIPSMIVAATGGYIGARYTRQMNADVLRSVVVATGIVVAAYFFWRSHQA